MSYGAKDIRVLSAIEGIRERAGMYIGSLDTHGVHQCLKEIITNSIDEALNGYGNKIWVNVDKDLVNITDEGRGIPFDKMDDGEYAIVNILTKTHAGGKFGQKSYSLSGGLNGVGATAVNALSEWFEVVSLRDNQKCFVRFEQGILKKIEITDCPSVNTGTMITFKLDKTLFTDVCPDMDTLAVEMKEHSYLNSNVHLYLNGKEYFSRFGLKDMLKDFVQEPLSSPMFIQQENGNYTIEIAMQYEKKNGERVYAYANNIPNSDGGTHVTGFRSALTIQLNKIAKEKKLIAENIDGSLWRRGLTAIISVKMQETPTFTSQIKSKLTSPEARTKVSAAVTAQLEKVLSDIDLEKIVSKMLLEKKAEDAAQRTREAVNRISMGGKSLNTLKDMPSKLADCNKKGGELFLTEGDSAGGSAKSARNPNTQAIMPLRGKVLNTTAKDLGEALENKEIRDIVTALGCGIGERFNINNLRYDKIIILADADSDGGHIALLLCALFLFHLPELVVKKKLFMASSPLYSIQNRGKVIYFYNDDELQAHIKQHGQPSHIMRYKGLGELNPDQLWETTMDPERRHLIPLTTADLEKSINLLTQLMGKDASLRRAYIMANAEEGEI